MASNYLKKIERKKVSENIYKGFEQLGFVLSALLPAFINGAGISAFRRITFIPTSTLVKLFMFASIIETNYVIEYSCLL